jgi:hypothetical protein
MHARLGPENGHGKTSDYFLLRHESGETLS